MKISSPFFGTDCTLCSSHIECKVNIFDIIRPLVNIMGKILLLPNVLLNLLIENPHARYKKYICRLQFTRRSITL